MEKFNQLMKGKTIDEQIQFRDFLIGAMQNELNKGQVDHAIDIAVECFYMVHK